MDEDNTNVELMFDDGFDEGYGIDSLEDIEMIEFRNIRDKDVCHFHFSDVDIAFEFYNRYARTRGFSARKNRTRKSHALICVLSDFRDYRAGMAQRMERKHAKVEGIQEAGEIAKLSSLTSSHSNGYNFSYRGPNDAVLVALES
ncbi:hypothetical protein AHAS_Ahas20G0241200 [Arachis hypogaea]